MWKEEDALLSFADEDKLFSSKYPQNCPICGCDNVHVYMHRFTLGDTIGPIWVWCDKCNSYLHAQFRIPESWKNIQTLDEDSLEANPEYLNKASDMIDQHINILVDDLSK